VTTFAESHQGDTIHLRGRLIPPLPLLLVTEPTACGDPGCLALQCVALTGDGRQVVLHRFATRPIDVLEHGPASELATRSGDVLAEHVDKPSDTPNEQGDEH
jgi:hypothetical protein